MSIIRPFIRLAITFAGFSFVAACGGVNIALTPTPTLDTRTPGYRPIPEFLQGVSPLPGGSVEYEDYKKSMGRDEPWPKGITVVLWLDKIDVVSEHKNVTIISRRVSLYIDGIKISNEKLFIASGLEPGSGPFYLTWSPVLTPGFHEAKFQVVGDQGNTLEYSWQFVLTEK